MLALGYAYNGTCIGNGGYSTGIISLTGQSTIYCYVGEMGYPHSYESRITNEPPSFGGGGGHNNGDGSPGAGGGGGTDFRIVEDSLYSRIIVAGGAGGEGDDYGDGGYRWRSFGR